MAGSRRIFSDLCGRTARQLALVGALGLGLAVGGTRPAAALVFGENLGNFPDAIAVSATFGTFTNLNINNTTINATGFLFAVANTSFSGAPDPAAAFRNDPDGDFAVNDVLTSAAATAIGSRQPFGIYSFGAGLPDDISNRQLGQIVSAPAGFQFLPEAAAAPGFVEFNFKHLAGVTQLGTPDGLIFDDDAAGVIPSVFTNPLLTDENGPFAFFFISTPDDFDFLAIPQIRNDPGIDIATEMAWFENGQVTTHMTVGGKSVELRPRGQLEPIPEPATGAGFLVGLAALALIRRRYAAVRA